MTSYASFTEDGVFDHFTRFLAQAVLRCKRMKTFSFATSNGTINERILMRFDISVANALNEQYQSIQAQRHWDRALGKCPLNPADPKPKAQRPRTSAVTFQRLKSKFVLH